MALALLPVAAVTASTSIALASSSSTSTPKSSDHRARYGKHVWLRGSVPGVADTKARVAFRRAGRPAWRFVRQTRTDADGGFRVRVRALRSGHYRARPAGSTEASSGTRPGRGQGGSASTRPTHLRVISRTRARVSNHAVVGRRVRIHGRVKPSDAHRLVRVKVAGKTLRVRTRHGGRFKVAWHPSRTGRFKVHVHASRDRIAAGSRDRAGHVTVFRRAVASWYGPGLYGSRTACGQTLEPSTLGVANRTLSCGTKVKLRYHGRQVKVRVIDRGPYAAGRDFDLTAATKQRLGFGDTGTLLSSK
jgi:peptidoglycan lytic transglycosylase